MMWIKVCRGVFLLMTLSGPMATQALSETREQFDARTRWWREAKFGMFIHWGLYAVPADATDLEGKKASVEVYFSNKRMQVKDYEKFAAEFNPVNFDARKWVKTAKATGMRYIVITSKHHDGFCMFDTKLTDYCITKATPFKRDPMKELAAECRRQDLKFCFYHSVMDWHHPDYLPRRPWDTRPADGASLDRYIEHMQGQLHELLTHYGPIGVLWFDGCEHSAEELHSREVNAMIRSIQPGILINNRNRVAEDFITPEGFIPAKAPPADRLWETCDSLNETWGYARNATNWKSAETLVRNLIDTASKGGNFLLNVGPTAEGEFPEAVHERLARIGAWMKVNGESIYATTRSPFQTLPFDGRATAKGNALYVHVFQWPDHRVRLTGLRTPVLSARALDGDERLQVAETRTGGTSVLTIPKPKKLDPIATVIELLFAGPPEVPQAEPLIKAQSDGSYLLKASDADIHGRTALYQASDLTDYIGSWEDPEDYVTWTLDIPPGRAGRYRVEVHYFCWRNNQGSTFTVGIEGSSKLAGSVKSTGSWPNFRSESLGEVELPVGKRTLAVRITHLSRDAAKNWTTAAMILHEVRLLAVR